MDQQFLSAELAAEAAGLKRANCDGYKLLDTEGQLVIEFFTGKFSLSAYVYDAVEHANADIAVMRQILPDLKQLNLGEEPAKPAETASQEKSVLPASYKPSESTEPVIIRDQRLAGEFDQLKNAGLTGYKLGVTDAAYPYPLSLMRGNSKAFHYDYLQHEDRANDLGIILEELPDLQLVGAPDFVS